MPDLLPEWLSPWRFHWSFRRARNHPGLEKAVYARMHANRIAQSARILGGSPKVWKHAARGFLNASSGRGNLRSLELAVTYRCNSRCAQCSCRLSHDAKKEKTRRLSEAEFKNAVDQAVDLGAFQFAINGGEPMLEEDLVFSLVEYIDKRHGRYVHLCTNGTLLTGEKVRKLAAAGLDSLEMGLDSAFEAVHDENRVPGSYAKIMEVVGWGRKHGVKVVLNTILTNEKVESADMAATVALAKRLGCLLQITPCCLTGAYKNRLDLMLTREARLYFHWLLAKSANNRSDLYSSLTRIKCPAAREKIGLQPYGDVVSCPLIQIPYGNIREQSLEDIQTKMLENPFYHLQKTQGCLPAMSEDFIRQYLMDPEAGPHGA